MIGAFEGAGKARAGSADRSAPEGAAPGFIQLVALGMLLGGVLLFLDKVTS